MRYPASLVTTLLVGQSLGLAAGWPPHTPLTSQSLAAWLKKVCAAATCQQVKAGALVPSHTTQVFPESRVYVLTKAGQKFYLIHDFTRTPGQPPLQELTFMPFQVTDQWTTTRLNTVAHWLNSLAGGTLNADVLRQCVTRLKQTNNWGMPFDPTGQGQWLNFLSIGGQETATGSCSWLAGKRNVGFGFAGKGRY